MYRQNISRLFPGAATTNQVNTSAQIEIEKHFALITIRAECTYEQKMGENFTVYENKNNCVYEQQCAVPILYT